MKVVTFNVLEFRYYICDHKSESAYMKPGIYIYWKALISRSACSP